MYELVATEGLAPSPLVQIPVTLPLPGIAERPAVIEDNTGALGLLLLPSDTEATPAIEVALQHALAPSAAYCVGFAAEHAEIVL